MIHLLTYANERYHRAQSLLADSVYNKGIFDQMHHLREIDLPTDFRQQYHHILSSPIGAGFCLWKPYIILQTLEKMEQNDILMYMDAADIILPEKMHLLRLFLAARMSGDTDILLTAGRFKNYQYTKRDCFVYMGCDSEQYWQGIQLEAGIIVFRKTGRVMRFVREWLDYCKDSRIITDEPNVCGKDNLPGFVDIRYDQSVLSLLAQKWEIPTYEDIREYTKCNVNDNR